MRKGNFRRGINNIVMIVFMLSIIFGQAPAALAKTQQTSIANPSNDLAQNNGVGLDALIPSPAGLVIGGTGITKGVGLLSNFVYFSQAQVDYIKANKSVDGLGLGSSWTSTPTLYSSYHNHGTPEYVYRRAEGINLKTALTSLGVDVTSGPVSIEAKAADGYSQIVSDAFGYNESRNYIAPDGSVGYVVDPILIFYDSQVATSTPDADTVVPNTTAAITDANPLFAFGQTEATEPTNCSFVKNTVKIRAKLDTPAFTISQGSRIKSISLSEIALIGIYETSYSWDNHGTPVTHNLKGVPLKGLLAKLDITVPNNEGLIINVDDGSGIVASSRAISYDEISRCFVAYDAFKDGQRIAGSLKPLRIYCPGQTQSRVLIENVVGAFVGEVPSGFEEIPGKTTTELRKTWTIKFNQAVDKDTVMARNIYVMDNNVKVETKLITSEDLKSVQVTPTADYTPNQEYRLHISNQLRAKDSQKNLNKSLVMPFIIDNN